jgi:cysteine synthase
MRGYRCIITTSPKCSQEKMDAIRAYGARLLVSPESAKEGEPAHYMEMARLLALRDPERYFDVDQYDSKFNAEGHYLTLGPEIWEQTAGTVTHFVAAGSTGGTVSGTGRFLKERNAGVRVVLADPVGSIFTDYFRNGAIPAKAGKYLVEGVGKGSIPGAMDFSLIDAVQPVSDQEAFDMCFRLCREEGLCAGGSAGLNLHAAMQVANTCEEDATIITVLPDLGIKYLSKIYNPVWLRDNGLHGPEEPRLVDPSYLPAAARA